MPADLRSADLRAAFTAMRVCAAQTQKQRPQGAPGRDGPTGPRGDAPSGTTVRASQGAVRASQGASEAYAAYAASINADVCASFASFASSIKQQFWSAFAPDPVSSPLAPYTSHSHPWSAWVSSPDLTLAREVQLLPGLFPTNSRPVPVARQAVTMGGGVTVARTVCTVDESPYIVTTVEVEVDEVATGAFVCTTEPLSAGPASTFYTAPIEQYFLDDPAAARAIFAAIGTCAYTEPPETARTIEAHGLLSVPVEVIGVARRDAMWHALVVPYAAGAGPKRAYERPYILGAQHTGAAVLVAADDAFTEITEIRSPVGAAIHKNKK
jgi:hypothetical protein